MKVGRHLGKVKKGFANKKSTGMLTDLGIWDGVEIQIKRKVELMRI
jgi:Fe2+ transport system protein FeoA